MKNVPDDYEGGKGGSRPGSGTGGTPDRGTPRGQKFFYYIVAGAAVLVVLSTIF